MSDNRWLTGYSAAVLGSILTSSSVGTWYAELRKFSFNPPNWIFAPVWSALYFLMALSAWLVWRKAGWSGARFALALFFGQLALNVAWSGLERYLSVRCNLGRSQYPRQQTGQRDSGIRQAAGRAGSIDTLQWTSPRSSTRKAAR